MKICRILFISVILPVIILFMGCYGGVKKPAGESSAGQDDVSEIAVEAYLFDVKLRRQGKPTSVRLDLYQTDSVVAMYGRGYFNKGAFWGRLTEDSMLIYFPSAKEYMNETIENLFLSFDCESELIGLNLLGYFVDFPDSAQISENLTIKTIEEDNDSRKISVSSVNCPWRLVLEYSKEATGWRIDEFEFDDSKEVTIKGNRRRYKVDTWISAAQFRIQIPSDALRVSP